MFTSVHFILLFDGLLLTLGSLMAYQERSVPALSIFGALAVLGIWQIVLASVSRSFARTYRWESSLIPTHYVQAMLHTSMYTYLGLYWVGVGRYAPLIVTQIVFGYLCDMLLSWSRGRVWKAGLGVVPIVLSTNLFMWFREPVFYLQFLLILLTFLGKEFVTWNRGGRQRHIFNPSAFSLSVASVLMLATGTVDWSHAVDIAVAFDTPPNFYEVIFLLGLVVQTLFVVTPVTCGAAFTLSLSFVLTPLIFGVRLSATPIQSAVFLGMTFLVSDPATSPRSHLGRFLFGMTYGAGVIGSFILLRMIHQPAIFDKLLIVPLVNLLVPLFDRLCDRVSPDVSSTPSAGGPVRPTHLARFGWLAAYLALFGLMLPDLKSPQPRAVIALPPPAGHISDDVRNALRGMLVCRRDFPDAFRPFGFRAEIANAPAIRATYRQRHDGSARPLGRSLPATDP